MQLAATRARWRERRARARRARGRCGCRRRTPRTGRPWRLVDPLRQRSEVRVRGRTCEGDPRSAAIREIEQRSDALAGETPATGCPRQEHRTRDGDARAARSARASPSSRARGRQQREGNRNARAVESSQRSNDDLGGGIPLEPGSRDLRDRLDPQAAQHERGASRRGSTCVAIPSRANRAPSSRPRVEEVLRRRRTACAVGGARGSGRSRPRRARPRRPQLPSRARPRADSRASTKLPSPAVNVTGVAATSPNLTSSLATAAPSKARPRQHPPPASLLRAPGATPSTPGR